jgi:uncharacterized protein (AIM24 family)/DNA-binding SARP family transcriptional activator
MSMTDAHEEEFLAALYKGGEFLSAGKVVDARTLLERANALQPKNEKAQNLLGLTYFKLGLFDRASHVYEGLVNENPVDPTLRVNLGLVYLKANNLERCIKEFEAATDLDPDHKKAHNYLGLALAQAGDYAKAKDHFVLAGSPTMAEKMERALGNQPAKTSTAPKIAAKPTPLPAPPEVVETGQAAEESVETVEALAPSSDRQALVANWGDQFQEPPAVAPITVKLGDETEMPVIDAAVEEEAVAEAPSPDQAWARSSGVAAPVEEDWGLTEQPPVQSTPTQVVWPAPATQTDNDWGHIAESEAAAPPRAETWQDDAAERVPEITQTWTTPEPETWASSAPSDGVEVDVTIETQPASSSGDADVSAEWTEAAPPPEAQPEKEPEWVAQPVSQAFSAPTSSPSQVGVRAPTGYSALEAQRLADLGASQAVLPEASAGAFHVGPDGLAVTVQGEVLTRLAGLVAMLGSLNATPETKRSRGRSTDQPFGTGAQQLQRVTGHGTLLLEGGRPFAALDLSDDEGTYIREERLFAFEEPLAFENGRLSGEGGLSLELVTLKGQGRVLLQLEGGLKVIPVPPGAPMVTPLARIVGWFGHVTPRLMGFAGQTMVELTGEGHALLAT